MSNTHFTHDRSVLDHPKSKACDKEWVQGVYVRGGPGGRSKVARTGEAGVGEHPEKGASSGSVL